MDTNQVRDGSRQSPKGRPFLTARWSELLMLNWEVPPELLLPHVPAGTELDLFEGKAYASVVGFRFRDTRVLGIKIPFHVNFPEVNLRFYVTRRVGTEVRRGVVFISELVPRFWIAFVARALYNERYSAVSMQDDVSISDSGVRASYRWGDVEHPGLISVQGHGLPHFPERGSRYEFIAEHYFGYAAQRNGSTLEYAVEHVPWRMWTNCEVRCEFDAERWYGSHWRAVLSRQPEFSFIAEGSSVAVYPGERL